MKKYILIIPLLLIVTALASCSNIDPVITHTDDTTDTYKVDTDDGTQKNNDHNDTVEYKAYGGGEDKLLSVDGAVVDTGEFAIRAYELYYMLGQTDFQNINGIDVSALTQFAFCHLFYDELYKMPGGSMMYRQASQEDIDRCIEQFFGKNEIDTTKSVLYNRGKRVFEMWQPEYGTDIYYNVNSAEIDGVEVIIDVTFYSDINKSEQLNNIVLKLSIENNSAVISAMKVN
ncbi:MAG: hypothetical protein IJT49_02240 [Clostridia bacterium]|nr:hypothetical protein [Clostridia bacterium]